MSTSDVPGDAAPPRISALGTNTLANKVASYALGLPASVVIARELGPAGRGGYQIPVTLALVATMLGSLGVAQAHFRTWSRERLPPDLFVTSAAVFGFFGSILGVLIVGAAYAVGRRAFLGDAVAAAVVLAAASVPFQVHASYGMGLLALAGRMPRSNFATTLGALVQTGLVLAWAVLGRLTVVTVLLFFVIGIVAQWTVIASGLRKVGAISPRTTSKRFLVRIVRDGVVMQPFVLFQFLNLRVDVFLVARYAGAEGVGIYTAGTLVAELVWIVSDSLGYSLVERQGNADDEDAYSITFLGARVSVLLVVLFGAPLLAASPFIIRLLFGDEFTGAIRVVAVLLPASAFMAVWRASSAAMSRFASIWMQSAISLLSLVVNVIVNVLAIPVIGVTGAAVASVVSYGLAAALVIGWLVRESGSGIGVVVPRPADLHRLVQFTSDVVSRVRAGRAAA